jgi:hypothetical protein
MIYEVFIIRSMKMLFNRMTKSCPACNGMAKPARVKMVGSVPNAGSDRYEGSLMFISEIFVLVSQEGSPVKVLSQI